MFSQQQHLRRNTPTVTPNQLCQCCKGSFPDVATIFDKVRKIPTRLKTPQYEARSHYTNLQQLVLGAREGCHLCSLIVGVLDSQKSWSWDLVEDFSSENKEMRTRVLCQIEYYQLDEAKYMISIVPAGTGGGASTEISLPMWKWTSYPQEHLGWAKLAQSSCYTVSEAHYDMMRDWLNLCKSEHSSCNLKEKFRRPTRLLDLSIDNSEDIKIVEGDSCTGPYAALSYSWGKVPQILLRQSNLQDFQKKIPFSNLSKVSQNTVSVCRTLNIQYLWIDALCIIQGPDGDFSSEAPRMQDVYAGAEITIVAASSKDTTEPFLRFRDPLQWHNCILLTPDNAHKGIEIKTTQFCHWQYDIPGRFNVDSRGWCFQEQFMSPRALFFSDKGIHWECRSGIACEHYPKIDIIHGGPVSTYEHESLKSTYTKLDAIKEPLKNPDAALALQKVWDMVLSSYSGMQLTKHEDKLVALAGIASIFEQKFQMQAAYGLWIDFFMQGLLWRTNSMREGARVTGSAPSWSWANLSNRSVENVNPGNDAKVARSSFAVIVSRPSPTGFPVLAQRDAEKERLCIRGKLVPCLSRSDKFGGLTLESRNWNNDQTLSLRDTISNGQYAYSSEFFQDIRSDVADLYCLLLKTEHYENWYHKSMMYNAGIVLKPSDTIKGAYERVGLFTEFVDTKLEGTEKLPVYSTEDGYLTVLWAGIVGYQDVDIV